MIWLEDLTRQIRGCGGRMKQTEVLALCAEELSRICDQSAKRAPMPEFENTGATMQLSWFWVDEQRALTLGVELEADATYLLMMDGTRSSHTPNPDHEQLRRAVQSFFDGWKPRA